MDVDLQFTQKTITYDLQESRHRLLGVFGQRDGSAGAFVVPAGGTITVDDRSEDIP